MKLDKKISIPFWAVPSARDIINTEIDSFLSNYKTTRQAQFTEENAIVYTTFIISISGSDGAEIKELMNTIERKLAEI